MSVPNSLVFIHGWASAPEIWQGHIHDYRQFRIALAKLAAYPFLSEGILQRA